MPRACFRHYFYVIFFDLIYSALSLLFLAIWVTRHILVPCLSISQTFSRHFMLPAPIMYRAFVQIWFIYMHLFLTFSSAAWHSPNKLGLCARHAQTFTIAWLPLYVLPLAYPLRSLRRIFFAKPLKVFPMPVIVFTICAENVCYKVSNTYYKLCNAC